MAEHEFPPIGTIAWADLTVDDAPKVRDFYAGVVGWTAGEVAMGDYSDYTMAPDGGDPVAGVCHARGTNAGLPPQWIVYVTVADLDHSVAQCGALGGSIVAPARDMGAYGRFAVVKDPAGAVMAIVQRPAAG
ncbi:MAG: VOC family protein [Candidatus Eisenbacteria bacterium]